MFLIKQNDRLPDLIAQLFDFSGNPINLELCSVKLRMTDSNGVMKENENIVIDDIALGKVRGKWREGDTAVAGTLRCEFKINMPDGKTISIPNDGYFLISVIPEL